MRAQHWRSASGPGQDHPPIAQIPALLDHVQDVGLSAGAGQTGEKEDCGPGGRFGMREAVIVVKPIQRDLSSICCLNKLTAETSGTHKAAMRILMNVKFLPVSLCVYLCLSSTYTGHEKYIDLTLN